MQSVFHLPMHVAQPAVPAPAPTLARAFTWLGLNPLSFCGQARLEPLAIWLNDRVGPLTQAVQDTLPAEERSAELAALAVAEVLGFASASDMGARLRHLRLMSSRHAAGVHLPGAPVSASVDRFATLALMGTGLDVGQRMAAPWLDKIQDVATRLATRCRADAGALLDAMARRCWQARDWGDVVGRSARGTDLDAVQLRFRTRGAETGEGESGRVGYFELLPQVAWMAEEWRRWYEAAHRPLVEQTRWLEYWTAQHPQALLLKLRLAEMVADLDPRRALRLVGEVVDQSTRLMADEPFDTLEYSCHGGRSSFYYRALELRTRLLDLSGDARCIPITREILSLHPQDVRGMRPRLVWQLLRHDRPAEALEAFQMLQAGLDGPEGELPEHAAYPDLRAMFAIVQAARGDEVSALRHWSIALGDEPTLAFQHELAQSVVARQLQKAQALPKTPEYAQAALRDLHFVMQGTAVMVPSWESTHCVQDPDVFFEMLVLSLVRAPRLRSLLQRTLVVRVQPQPEAVH